jgi:hypothetical protein
MNDETFHAVVKGVHVERLGDALTVAAAIGATTLSVRDVADFDDEGGYLRLNGTVLEYLSTDDDLSTITLAVALVAAAAVDDKVEAWDKANGQPAVVHKAVVDQIDGFDGFATAVVSQSIAHALSQDMRDGPGESVTLTREGAELRVVEVHGRTFSLAALQYLQGGMTTRQAEDEAGVDIVGSEAGVPGIFAYGPGGSPTVLIDATTGNASFIGEIGTALPGDIGIFMHSGTFSEFGVQVTHPVMLFNVQASRDDPSIQASNDGVGGTSLFLFSGAETTARETRLIVENGRFEVGIEHTANDQVYIGAFLSVQRDFGEWCTDAVFGTWFGKIQTDSIAYFAGYDDSASTALRGFQYLFGPNNARVLTGSAMEIVSPDTTAFRAINASAFNVTSDAGAKTNRVRVEGALAAIETLTVYDYDTPHGAPDGETIRARGVIAQDVAKVAPIATVEMFDGTQGVDLYALGATTVAGLQELAGEMAALRAQVAALNGKK